LPAPEISAQAITVVLGKLVFKIGGSTDDFPMMIFDDVVVPFT
jgi:hypothetical protein